MTRLAQLEAWLQGIGISWNVELVQLVDNSRGCSGLALGVQAVADVPEGAHLCTIPKAACISIRTSSIADILEAENLGGGLGLTLALLHEMSLKEKSKWWVRLGGSWQPLRCCCQRWRDIEETARSCCRRHMPL